MLELSKFSTTKKQGDAGLAAAIHWFIFNGYTICIPLADSQDYDLVVDLDGFLQKVQVKTTFCKVKGCYKVSLLTRTTKDGKNIFKSIIDSKVDLLFVLTESEEKYLIPTKNITTKSIIRFNEKFDLYKV